MPSGLIDGGVVEIETLGFGENDKTSTTQAQVHLTGQIFRKNIDFHK